MGRNGEREGGNNNIRVYCKDGKKRRKGEEDNNIGIHF
jgi:hypothetical protein